MAEKCGPNNRGSRARGSFKFNRALSAFSCFPTMKTSLQALLLCGVLGGIQMAEASDLPLVQTSGYGVNGLVLWLAADSGVSRDFNNHVTSLVDKTNNFTLSAKAPYETPIYVFNGLHGRPVLRFSGNQCLYSSDNFGAALDHDMTIIVVAMTTASPNQLQIPLYLGQDTAPADCRALMYYSGKEFFDGHYAGFFGEPMVSNAFVVSAGSVNSALTQATFYRNGARTVVSDPAEETNGRKLENLSSSVWLGAASDPASCWQGDIAEALVYDRQLTDAEVHSIWLQLSFKYDLPQSSAP